MITQQDLDNYTGDKRDKKYREMKEQLALQNIVEENTELEDKQVGDIVADVLEATGVAKVAKALLGEDCGCEDRQRKLNETFRQGTKQVRCFTPEEYDMYEDFMVTRKHNVWQPNEAKLLFNLYEKIFNTKYKIKRMCTTCRGTGNILRQITLDLDRVYHSLN